ncbi:MAG: MraY family glycosyltransferase [Cyanobacteriota bacterium]
MEIPLLNTAISNSHLFGFCLAFLISLALVPLVRNICIKKGLYDLPDDRKIHETPIPRLGGVAIWFASCITIGFLILWFWHYPHDNALSGMFAGGSIIFILGVIDDVYGLSAKLKFFVQIIAAGIAYMFGVQILALHIPFIDGVVQLGILSIPITIIWIVAICNAFNFIDGVDGLAGGVTAISAVTLGVVAYYTQQPVAAVVAAVIAGSMLGFLVYNFPPAKIFMGDSGALFAGFILASLTVTGVLKTVAFTILLPMIILSVPLLDITYAVFRRLAQGKSPFVADGEHIHHRLLKAGMSQNRTIMIFYFICIASGVVAASLVHATRVYLIFLLGLLVLMFIIANSNRKKKVVET